MVQLVGILNITPDSFSDGNQYLDPQAAIAYAATLFDDGASLIDVGAESTRPHATPLSADQEWERLEPVLRVLIPRYPEKLSLDSYHPETAYRAFSIGPVIINDVSGLTNPAMQKAVIELKAICIISQLPAADIQTAHAAQPLESIDVVRDDLLKKAHVLIKAGHDQSSIILDPGIGFGKSAALNWELLSFAKHVPDYAVMIGYSRKRFLGESRMELTANIAAGRIAQESGARYLRVHDIAGHRRVLDRLE